MDKPYYRRDALYYMYIDKFITLIPNLSDEDLEDAYQQGKLLRHLLRHDLKIPGSGRTRLLLEISGFDQEKADTLCEKEEKAFRLMKEERWRRGKGFKGLKD